MEQQLETREEQPEDKQQGTRQKDEQENKARLVKQPIPVQEE